MKTIFNVIKGVISALLAAYVFMALYSLNSAHPFGLSGSLLALPIFGLLYTFWLVIPLGAGLGVVIPKMVNGRSWQIAALYGGLLGAAVGAIVYVVLSLIKLMPPMQTDQWRDFTIVLLAMILYCAAWTGVYALFCRSKFV